MDKRPALIVGLGNPGPEYAGTRHNVGFLVVSELAGRLGAGAARRAHRAELAEAFVGGRKLILARPQTMMNLSGESVSAIMRYYRFGVEDLLVLYDDVDLPFGRIRLRPDGSAGGHNGVRSLIHSLASSSFARVRVGVGRPPRGDAISHVLGRWTKEERESLPAVVSEAADAVEAVLCDGLLAAMNLYNQRKD